MFRIFGQNVPKGVEKWHPTCPEDHFVGKFLIEILSFYIFFRTLREVNLVLRRKSASRVGETAFRASRKFFQEKQILLKKNQLQTISRLYTKNVRKNEKNYLTGVSNLQSTCTDDRSNEKKLILPGVTASFSELRLKIFRSF